MKTSIIEWHDPRNKLPTVDIGECIVVRNWHNTNIVQYAGIWHIGGKALFIDVPDSDYAKEISLDEIVLWASFPELEKICDDISARSYDEL